MKILIIGALLIVFGAFSIYSVSIFESFGLTLDLVDAGLRSEPSNYYYFWEQVSKIGIGLMLSFIIRWIPLSFFKKRRRVLFLCSVGLLLLLFVPGMSLTLNGSNARLKVPGGTIQPGEFYKIGFVVYLTSWLLKKKSSLPDTSFFLGFVLQVFLLTFVFFLIPDLGTLLVLVSVAFILFRYVGGKIKHIILMFGLGILFMFFAATQFSYIKKRLDYFFNPTIDARERGIGRQTRQALIAVGGGGLIGKGYGKGLQKFGYIPEAQSDFIFAAFSEEIGFLGNSVLLTLYFLLAYYFLHGLANVRDERYRLLGIGLISMIMMQTFINIGVNIKLLPLTGLTLPFVSHGGSALIVNMIEIVLLQKILIEQE